MEEREEVLIMPDGKRHPFHRLANGEITRQEAAAEISRYHGLGEEEAKEYVVVGDWPHCQYKTRTEVLRGLDSTIASCYLLVDSGEPPSPETRRILEQHALGEITIEEVLAWVRQNAKLEAN